jgi:glycerol-3-phosphate dehydrogenase
MAFSGKRREQELQDMSESIYDVFVIGGGITGAGIALDAITRGMKTALVEMQDFAAGTSSRSTKLVHGGLRYLKQFEVKMVAEVGKERAIVYENGPHVTRPERMMLPIYKGGTFGMLSSRLGLALYDYLAGVRQQDRYSMLSAAETLSKVPLLKSSGLKGSGYYVEYRTDDARLTLEVLKKAVQQGAKAVNYTEVTQFLHEERQVRGVVVKDQLSGTSHTIYAKCIVNAAGPWVDRLRALNGVKEGKSLRLTKGVHLVFDQSRFPLQQAIYFDAADGRMLFAIPRAGKTYLGTTDTFYDQDPATPCMSAEDRSYLLTAANHLFPKLLLSEEAVESSWAGLRPLIAEPGKSPSAISRKDEIWQDHTGLISIAGGKLTGYRKMAQAIVDIVAKQLIEQGEGPYGPCITQTLSISGGDIGGSDEYEGYVQSMADKGKSRGLTMEASRRLAEVYGSNAEKVFQYAGAGRRELAGAALPTEIYAALMYGMDEELAMKPVDFWVRRTGALLFDRLTVERWKRQVLEVMTYYYKWDEEKKNSYAVELEHTLAAAITPCDY